MSERYPDARLYGYDLTPAMVDYAEQQVSYGSAETTFEVLDLTTQPVPLAAGRVDLIAMTAVLHVLDDPLAVCTELRRLLAPDGTFLLFDWIKQPLGQYLEMMMTNVPPERAEVMEKAMLRLSVAHNKYTVEDWIWLLDKGGFSVVHHQQLRSPHFHAFVCKVNGDQGS
jgi:SAM-dependent methyltransferase